MRAAFLPDFAATRASETLVAVLPSPTVEEVTRTTFGGESTFDNCRLTSSERNASPKAVIGLAARYSCGAPTVRGTAGTIPIPGTPPIFPISSVQIGRASCRERVWQDV